MTQRKLKLDDLPEGAKAIAVTTYWRSDNDYQEEKTGIQVRVGKKGHKELYRLDNGERFYVGINSAVEFRDYPN